MKLWNFRQSIIPPDRFSARLESARLLRTDGCHAVLEVHPEANRLEVRLPGTDDGVLMYPCRVGGYGEVMLAGATLIPGDHPYELTVETARAQLNRLREQIARIHRHNRPVGRHVIDRLQRCVRSFSRCLFTDEPSRRDELAAECLRETLDLSDDVASARARLIVPQLQGRTGDRAPPSLGIGLDERPLPGSLDDEFREAFDHVRIRPDWRRLEPTPGALDWAWLDSMLERAAALGKPITLGPILDFRTGGMPVWLDEWLSEPEVLETLLVNHIETMVDRTRGRVGEWLVTSRTNSSGVFGFGAEVRLRLTRTLLVAARAVDPNGRFGIELDRPWGDYARPGRPLQYPIVFTDTLLRTDCRPDFLSLELAFGYAEGSVCRPLLAIWEILDEFGEFDLPLDVALFFPAHGTAVESGGFEGTDPEQVQADRAERMMLVALAKEDVRRVTWGCHRDPAPGCPWPGSGLIDAEGRPRPALARLLHLRRRPA